jgi:tetratricopeptide (TPR) repeat protein
MNESRPISPERNSSPGVSPSPSGNHSESSGDSNSSDKNVKKKRANARHALFAGLSQFEKEKMDHAIRILDIHLHYLWHKRCYARRLRAILEFENPARSKILLTKAKALFATMQKDGKLQSPHSTFDSEWFHLSRAGALLWTRHSTQEGSLQTIESYQNHNAAFIEMIQCFVQSIVLASRIGDHLKVIQNCKAFWQVLCVLLHSGKLDHIYWNLMLWRGMLSVGNALMETLKAIKFCKVPFNNEYLPMNTDAHQHIPLGSLWELYNCKVYGVWNDKYHSIQRHEIDLLFCSELLLFACQTLFVARKNHRALNCAKKLLSLFNNIHEAILNPLIQGIEEVLVTPTPQQDAINIRSRCRYLVALSLLESAKRTGDGNSSQSEEVVQLYFKAIEVAKDQGNTFLQATLHNELGDYLFHLEQYTGATVHWANSIDCLLGTADSVKDLIGILSLSIEVPTPIGVAKKLQTKTFGIEGSFLLVNLLSKLARFVYHSNHDKQNELLWVIAEVLFLTLASELGNPNSYVGYKDFCADMFLKKHYIFKDKFKLNPTLLFNNLSFVAAKIVERGASATVLPLLAIADSIASNSLCSLPQSNMISLIKAEILAKLGFIDESLKLFSVCSRRQNLRKKPEDDISFDDTVFPLNHNNWQSLKNFMLINVTDKSKILHSSFQNLRFELTKAKIILEVLKMQQHFQVTAFAPSSANETEQGDFDFAMSDLFLTLRILLSKCILPIQSIVRKSSENLPDFEMGVPAHSLLLESFFCLSKLCYLQRKYRSCIKWYSLLI